MKETYVEAGVKRKENIKTIGIRVLLIVALLLSLIISTLSTWLYFVSVIAILAIIFIFPKLKIEYEYIYCDGQIDFDRIMGGARRKTALRVDLENVELVAPSTSDELLSFTRMEGIKTKDFSSLDRSAKTYTMVVSKEGQYYKIIFEPTSKMLEAMRLKSPRKVKIY